MLTDTGRELFAEQGFLAIRDVLQPDSVEEVRSRLVAVKAIAADLEYSRPGMNLECPGGGFLGQTGTVKSYRGVLRAAFHLEDIDPFFADLGQRSAFYRQVVARLLPGRSPALLSVNFWGKPALSGSAQPWHQDLAYLGPDLRSRHAGAVTAWLALDPARMANGCLEFYPGSHRLGDLEHLGSTDPAAGEQIHVDVRRHFGTAEPTAVELDPGSAVFFDGLVVHGSRENTSPASREALSFSYLY